MEPISATPPIERLTLSRMALSDAQYVRRNAEVQVEAVGHAVDKMLVRLESHVLAHQYATNTERHLVATDTWKFPTSPWQFFKECHTEAWWLRWLTSRWPVRYNVEFKRYERTVTIGRNLTFPDCNRMFPPDFGRGVVVDTVQID